MFTRCVSTYLVDKSILKAGENICSENKSIDNLWNLNLDQRGRGSPLADETSYLIKNFISRLPARDAFIWIGISRSWPLARDLKRCLFSKLNIRGWEHMTNAFSIEYSDEQFLILKVPFLHSERTTCLFYDISCPSRII